MPRTDTTALLARASAHSRWLANRLGARPALGEWLAGALDEPFTREGMHAQLDASPWHDDAGLKQALRELRQRVMALIVLRDLNGLADLAEVVRTCTELAEVTVRVALDWHHRELAAIHGEPLDERGGAQRMIVVGMGKLGGRELNVSSDIDLIFIYPQAGETAGPRRLDNHEFFTRLGKRLIAALNDATADGFVFRVDMRLRPYGESGPLVSSLAMLEEYFYAQAREWERYAWIKARALTGERIDELEALRRPFVFRKYLDFGAFAAMRELHAQIRREVARKDLHDNIKLGPGGIREVEFIAQVFQLIRGGREPALQARPTRETLARLAALDLLPAATVARLDDAYVFLRNLEHRLQYLDDAQTQRLPHDPDDRRRVATAMGYADWEGFEVHLNSLRQRVAEQFEQVFGAPQEDQSGHPLAGLCELPEAAARERLAGLGYAHPDACLAQLSGLCHGSRYASLPAVNKAALDGLLPPLVQVAAGQPNPDDTLARILALLEAIARRAPYLQLLREYPQTLTQVARLVSASPWAAQYLTRQPFLLDELLDTRALYAPPDWDEARRRLDERLGHYVGDTGARSRGTSGDAIAEAANGARGTASLPPATGSHLASQGTAPPYAGDVERQMDELRHFKQSETFRLLAQDLAGRLSVEHLSDHLSWLADLLLGASLELVWRGLPGRHREHPAFAVIAYGKLGGKELGYASDLDIVFLYDDPHPDAQEIYAKLAKRLNTWIGTLTAAGILYETDLRLRPDGAAGLLVSSVEAFEDYQLRHAWTWEHQALTRARYSCGDRAVGERFEAIRVAVLRAPRDAAELRAKVLEMRQKMRDGHPNPTPDFDLKHDPGGLVDVEFAVQYLVLAHAAAHPGLTANIGNIALLKRCAELGLLAAEVALPAADAYRELRRMQHAAKLQNGEFGRVPHAQAEPGAGAVLRLWSAVFPPM